LEKHHGFTVRAEAVRAFEVYCELRKHHDELVGLGGDPKDQYRGKEEGLMTRRSEIIQNAERILFDINALTVDSDVECPQNVRDLADFITGELIPRFAWEIVLKNPFVFDGKRLIDEMHGKGLNCRYLGTLLKVVKSESDNDLAVKVGICAIESEMIARSFKKLAREAQNYSLDMWLRDLNIILGFTKDDRELVERVREKCVEKYGVAPDKCPCDTYRMLILRSVALAFGVSIRSRNYSSAVSISDIVSIEPVVNFPFIENLGLRGQIDLATTVHSLGDLDLALQLFYMALAEAEKSVTPFDRDMSLCYFYLSLIYQAKERYEEAFHCGLRSMIIHERHCDQLHPEIIVRYSILADIANSVGKPYLAFALAARAGHLSCLLCPVHPWCVTAFANAGEFAVNIDVPTALSYYQMALNTGKSIGVEKNVIARIYQDISAAHLRQQELEQAAGY
jgi:tetratricopeptide (TPR) repeat protein